MVHIEPLPHFQPSCLLSRLIGLHTPMPSGGLISHLAAGHLRPARTDLLSRLTGGFLKSCPGCVEALKALKVMMNEKKKIKDHFFGFCLYLVNEASCRPRHNK